MNEAGWEIATHGYKWIDYRDTPAELERQHIAEAIRIHTEVAGERPLGFYQGRRSINTIPLGMRGGRLRLLRRRLRRRAALYIEGPRGPQLIVPYTLDSNDMRFATPQGFNSGDQFYAYLKDSFDTLYAEGATAPKMLSIGLHCRLVGRPGRAASLARFLDYALSHDKVWIRDAVANRAPLDREARASRRLEAVAADQDAVCRTVRRRLRALALGRGGGSRRRADARRGHRRGARQGDGGGDGEGERRRRSAR